MDAYQHCTSRRYLKRGQEPHCTSRRYLRRGQEPPQAASKAAAVMGKSGQGSSMTLTCQGHLCARTVLMTLQGTAGKKDVAR